MMPEAEMTPLGDRHAPASLEPAVVRELRAAALAAEAFISGFEDDELQEGIADLLAQLRSALGKAAASPSGRRPA